MADDNLHQLMASIDSGKMKQRKRPTSPGLPIIPVDEALSVNLNDSDIIPDTPSPVFGGKPHMKTSNRDASLHSFTIPDHHAAWSSSTRSHTSGGHEDHSDNAKARGSPRKRLGGHRSKSPVFSSMLGAVALPSTSRPRRLSGSKHEHGEDVIPPSRKHKAAKEEAWNRLKLKRLQRTTKAYFPTIDNNTDLVPSEALSFPRNNMSASLVPQLDQQPLAEHYESGASTDINNKKLRLPRTNTSAPLPPPGHQELMIQDKKSGARPKTRKSSKRKVKLKVNGRRHLDLFLSSDSDDMDALEIPPQHAQNPAVVDLTSADTDSSDMEEEQWEHFMRSISTPALGSAPYGVTRQCFNLGRASDQGLQHVPDMTSPPADWRRAGGATRQQRKASPKCSTFVNMDSDDPAQNTEEAMDQSTNDLNEGPASRKKQCKHRKKPADFSLTKALKKFGRGNKVGSSGTSAVSDDLVLNIAECESDENNRTRSPSPSLISPRKKLKKKSPAVSPMEPEQQVPAPDGFTPLFPSLESPIVTPKRVLARRGQRQRGQFFNSIRGSSTDGTQGDPVSLGDPAVAPPGDHTGVQSSGGSSSVIVLSSGGGTHSTGPRRKAKHRRSARQDSEPVDVVTVSPPAVASRHASPDSTVDQLASDEALARRLQEEMDMEFATSLASRSPAMAPQGQGRGQNYAMAAAAAIAAQARPPLPPGRQEQLADLDRQVHFYQQIGAMSEYDYAVHRAIVYGMDFPDPPPTNRRSIDQIINPEVLEFMQADPGQATLQRYRGRYGAQPRATARSRRGAGAEVTPPTIAERAGWPAGARRRHAWPAAAYRATGDPNLANMGLMGQGLDAVFLGSMLDPLAVGLGGRRGRRRGRANGPLLPPIGLLEGADYDQLWELADRLGDVKSRGLSREQIDRLPTRTFKVTEVRDGADTPECHVCMSEYEDGDNLRILPCFHEYHAECIDQWLKNNATCPVCRVEVKFE